MSAFPNDFLWGAVCAAYPTEGALFDSDWWRWEQRPGRIVDGSDSKVAADHFARFEDDFDLARKLGHRAHCFNIEWSRVQPTPDAFDEGALSHYAAVFDALHARGIEPICALHHVTNPTWFVDRGGWIWRGAVAAFERYARRIADVLASKCRWWVPIVEPMNTVSNAYIERRWPPTVSNPLRACRALGAMTRAHVAAYRAIRDCRPEARVGVAIRVRAFAPHDSDSPWDVRAVEREERRCNRLLIEGLAQGRLPWFAGGPKFDAGCFDFVSVAFHGQQTVHFDPRRPTRLFCRRTAPTAAPWRFVELLSELAAYNAPLLVAGDGVATNDDADRRRQLLDDVTVIDYCLQKGIDVRGYLHYALLDGFEWTRGLAARCGLVHVARDTLARTPNPSAYLLKDVIENGAIRPGTIARFCPDWAPPVLNDAGEEGR